MRQEQQFDHVVVGAGAAGCVVAERLSREPGVRVLLLEAGPGTVLADEPVPHRAAALQQTEANWGYRTVAQPHLDGRTIDVAAGRGLGGGGRINYLLWLRGHPHDYDAWAGDYGMAGWDWDTVEPFFDPHADNTHVLRPRSAELLHPLTQRFLQSAAAAGVPTTHGFNGGSQLGVGLYQSLIRDGERDNTRRSHLDSALDRPNLTVLTDAAATRILLDGACVRGVEYRRPDGQAAMVSTQSAVLSAGPVRSPQLLMCSGIGPAAHLTEHGIDVLHDLPAVGANLHDHANAPLVWTVNNDDQLWAGEDNADTQQQWNDTRTGPLASLIEAGGFLDVGSADGRPEIQLTLMLADFTAQSPRAVTCVVTLVTPRSRGHVRLRSADPRQAPLLDPGYLSDPYDRYTLSRGLAAARGIFANPPLSDVMTPASGTPEPEDVDQYLRQTMFSISHPVGSCRAGAGEAAVIDAELRVHGVIGLRVIDSSVMPTIPRGNPFAATVMIARRGAELLATDR